jgi:hypothetical protein
MKHELRLSGPNDTGDGRGIAYVASLGAIESHHRMACGVQVREQVTSRETRVACDEDALHGRTSAAEVDRLALTTPV